MVAVEASWPEQVQEEVLHAAGGCTSILSFTDNDERFYSAGELRMTLQIMANAWGETSPSLTLLPSPVIIPCTAAVAAHPARSCTAFTTDAYEPWIASWSNAVSDAGPLLGAVQMVVTSSAPQQPAEIRQATAQFFQSGSGIPASVFCNGDGSTGGAAAPSCALSSRMTNPCLTRCAALGAAREPGDVSASQVWRARARVGLIQAGAVWVIAGKNDAWRRQNAAALAAAWRAWWLVVGGDGEGEAEETPRGTPPGESHGASASSQTGGGLGGMIILEQDVGTTEDAVIAILRECRDGASPRGGLRMGGISIDPTDEWLVAMVHDIMSQGCNGDEEQEGSTEKITRGEEERKAEASARQVGACVLSAAAVAIGAVTCVSRADGVLGGGLLHGDNCLWQGVRDVLLAQDFSSSVRVVILGNGSLACACCYALLRLPSHSLDGPPFLLAPNAGGSELLSESCQIITSLDELSLALPSLGSTTHPSSRLLLINAMDLGTDSSSHAIISDGVLKNFQPTMLDLTGPVLSVPVDGFDGLSASTGKLSPMAIRAQDAGCRVICAREVVVASVSARMQRWACLGDGEQETETVLKAIRKSCIQHN